MSAAPALILPAVKRKRLELILFLQEIMRCRNRSQPQSALPCTVDWLEQAGKVCHLRDRISISEIEMHQAIGDR